MAKGARDEVRYTAFLSYSHTDAAAARRLHRRLESYRLPRRLAGTETPRGIVPDRLWPIFRDREELPAASDLSETVRDALAQSGALIILCSPNSADSLWVAEEIATFRNIHPDRPILAAILDGDPPDCFPAALRAFGRDGTWHEPLATDLRRGKDGEHLGLLKLVAGITGVGLDELVQRDAARKIRRVMAVTGAALIAMLIMAALAVVALQARREAERQGEEARGLAEFMHTDLRQRLRGVGRLDVMRAVNERALAYYDRQLQTYGRPTDRLMRARILQAVGEDSLAQGNQAAALARFRETYATTASLLAESPNDPERIFAQAQSEYWIGRVSHLRGDFGPALAAYQRYREQATRINELDPDNPTYLGELAYSESNLGIVNLSGLNRPQAARGHFQQSLQWFLKLAQIQPEYREWTVEAADAHAWISDTWFVQRRFREARAERLAERRMKLALLAEDQNNRAYRYAAIIAARSLARIDIELEQFGRALMVIDQTRPQMAELLQLDPQNLVWRYQAVRIEVDASRIHEALGNNTLRRQALRRGERLLAEVNAVIVEPPDEHIRLRDWILSQLASSSNRDRQGH